MPWAVSQRGLLPDGRIGTLQRRRTNIIRFFHVPLANALLLFFLIAAAWGLVSFLRKQSADGRYWGILAMGELLALAQGAIGVLLWLSEAPRLAAFMSCMGH